MKKILFSLFMLSLLASSVIAQQPMQKSGDNNRNKEMRNTPKPDMKKSNKKMLHVCDGSDQITDGTVENSLATLR